MVSCPCVHRGGEEGGSSSKANSSPKTVNIFLGYFFMVNFCLGTGFLGVPFSFFYSGYLAAAPTLVLAAFVTWLTSTWLLEVMARAQALEQYKSFKDSSSKPSDMMDINNGNVKSLDDGRYLQKFEITDDRKFEPVELGEIFVGKWFKYIYLIVVTIYSFLACWSFSTVAGTAWASNIPYNFSSLTGCSEDAFHHQVLPQGGCLYSYYFSVFLFGILMIFLSVLDLKEQAIVQVFLGSARFLTVGAIVVYSIVKLSQGGDACEDDDNIISTFPNTSQSNLSDLVNATRYTSYDDIVFKFDPRGWVAAIPVFTYAFIIHTGISSLSHPVKQKAHLHWMLAAMSVTALVSYMSLGLVVPLWFKASVQETITLNWGGFTSSTSSTGLRVLSYYLIFFPSLDVMSAFPLTIHCIVNNIYIILTGQDTSKEPRWKKRDWLLRFGLRFVAALLPLLAAMGIANLIYVLKYAGLVGFTIALFFPAVLQLRSIYVCNREFGSFSAAAESNDANTTSTPSETDPLIQNNSKNDVVTLSGVLEFRRKKMRCYMTPYSRGYLSHPVSVLVILAIGVCLFILAVTSLGVGPRKLTCSIYY